MLQPVKELSILKLGISNNNLCECNQLETVEHYLLHCERYFNEREALRTHIFNTTGTRPLLRVLTQLY